MARPAKKQKLNENTEVNETEARDSLKPGAKAVDDPKAITHKSALLAKMIGAANSMDSEELLKYFNGMMDYHGKVGHGMGVTANQTPQPQTKPSAASHNHSYGNPSDPTPHLGGHHPSEEVKAAIKADIATMFEGTEGLDEEFKTNATVLFEAAVEARVGAAITELTEEYNETLEKNLDQITEELVSGLDSYLDYVASEWMTENQVAVESSLRNEMAADFINGLNALLKEHNVNISDDQVEIVDTMAQKIDELEGRVSDLLSEKAELESYVSAAEMEKTLNQVCEGLTLSESEKLRELAKSVEADTIEAYAKKVSVIKESNFVKTAKKTTITEALEDEVEQPEDGKKESVVPPQMKNYAAAIARTTVKY